MNDKSNDAGGPPRETDNEAAQPKAPKPAVQTRPRASRRNAAAVQSAGAPSEPVGAGVTADASLLTDVEKEADVAIPNRRVTRATRRPFGSQTQKLSYEQRPGFHRHWFNNTPGRLDDAIAAGYMFVEDKEGRKVARPVGTLPTGAVMMGYLMEIPKEWYDEDMLAQQARVNETDQAIRRGDVASGLKEGKYIPATGIKIGYSA